MTHLNQRRSSKEEAEEVSHDVITDDDRYWYDKPVAQNKTVFIFTLYSHVYTDCIISVEEEGLHYMSPVNHYCRAGLVNMIVQKPTLCKHSNNTFSSSSVKILIIPVEFSMRPCNNNISQ